ncbi:MAG: hypothetical protein JWR75_1508 [Devosia sp.]|nr:hypothetical protein [Devosia sp.]
MRNTLILAATVLAALTAPVLAQVTPEMLAAAHEVYDAADISDEAHIALYCGAAYTLIGNVTRTQGDTAAADAFEATAQGLLADAEALLIEEGMSTEDRTKTAEAFTYVANAGVIEGTEVAEYTQEDCDAAAAE